MNEIRRQLTRCTLATALFIAVLPAASAHTASVKPIRSNHAPIAVEEVPGTALLYQFVESPTKENETEWVYFDGNYPVRICGPTHCVVANTAFFFFNHGGFHDGDVRRTLYRKSRITWTDYIDEAPVTFELALDGADPTSGYTLPSNPVGGKTDDDSTNEASLTVPQMSFSYSDVVPSKIYNVLACLNKPRFDEDFTLSKFRTATYAISDNGVQVQQGALDSGNLVHNWWELRGGNYNSLWCEDEGSLPFPYLNFGELEPGHVYQLTFALSGPTTDPIVGTLDFVTPGGCPTSNVPSPDATKAATNTGSTFPINYAFIDTNSNFQGYIERPSIDEFYWRAKAKKAFAPAVSAGRFAPVYASWSKTRPFFTQTGRITGVNDTWKYIREIDDWAQIMAEARPITVESILDRTVYSDCRPDQVRIEMSPLQVGLENPACKVQYEQVVPTGVGTCVLRTEIRRVGVSKRGVTGSAAPTTLLIPYNFSSVGKFVVTKPIILKTSRSLRATSLARLARLKVSKSSTIAVKVSGSSRKMCSFGGETLHALRAGTCRVTVTVRPLRGKVTSKALAIQIRR